MSQIRLPNIKENIDTETEKKIKAEAERTSFLIFKYLNNSFIRGSRGPRHQVCMPAVESFL